MKIVIVTRKFFPMGDATSNVVGNIAEALSELGCNVKVIAVSEYKMENYSTKWNGIDVQFFYESGFEKVDYLKKVMFKKPGLVFISIVKKFVARFLRKVNPYYRKLSLDPRYIHAYKKAFSELGEDYDLCLLTLMPQETVWTAYSCAISSSKLAVYQLDTYWNNEVLPFKYTEDRFKFEKTFSKNVRLFLTTPQIKKINDLKDYSFSKNLVSAEFPMVKRQKAYEITSKAILHCVFLGTLYADIRPPEKVVTAISRINSNKAVFDFYGSNQELIIISKDYEAAKNIINLNGSVSSEDAQIIRDNADVLINIDNVCTNQVPSKIFDYISTGKPIVNFYFNEDSCILGYLSKYPLCLNVNLNNLDDFDKDFVDFIESCKDKTIPFSYIEEVYKENTPKYVANQIIDAYKSYKER